MRTTIVAEEAVLEELREIAEVALAEAMGAQRIATLDRRRSSGVRPAHVATLDLVPRLG